VYGVDLNPAILAHAVARIRDAGLGDRFEPINQLSFEATLPVRVDVLISEIIGNLADNEDFQPILQDAIQRFVAPGGRILPMTTSSYVVPVAAALAHRQVQHGAAAQLTSAYDIAALYRAKRIRSPFDLYYDCILPRSLYLGRPAMLRAYHGAWDQPAAYRCERSFAIERPGRLTGFKGYFVADLTPTTTLDISGDDIAAGEASDSWKHAYLPIEHPIDVVEGDRLELCVSRRYPVGGGAFRQIYEWSGRVERAGRVIGQFAQGMDAGSRGGRAA
jgi:protein arginine N-methyltransferase 1